MIPRPARAHTLILLTLVGAVSVATGSLVGCGPRSAPTPTPTAVFATEEEAFAAAEEVYRAYNEAGNANREGANSPRQQDFLVGDALEGYLDGQELLRNNKLIFVGSVTVASFTGESAELNSSMPTVKATVCLDVSETQVLDASGTNVTPSDRPELIPQAITMIHDGDGFFVAEEGEGDLLTCLIN